MTIKIGDKIPSATFTRMTPEGPKPVTSDELFNHRRVALFAVPGAFTPTCSAKHLPGFVAHADTIRQKGIDEIIAISVNDVFVMDAWGKSTGVGDKVTMLADGNGDFVKAIGLDADYSKFGMGHRAQRFSMLVDDGTVKSLNVDAGGAFEKSNAETLISQL